MGYDITAFREGLYQFEDPLARRRRLENDPAAEESEPNVVAYMHTHMDAFNLLRAHGYDWFEPIGAASYDGGVSGTGGVARISVEALRNALATLRAHEPGTLESKQSQIPDVADLPEGLKLAQLSDLDEWTLRRSQLDLFMSDCVAYCEAAGSDAVSVEFA